MTETSFPLAARPRRRLSPGMVISVTLLTVIAALILLPIVFTFLYSFFPKSEITAYFKLRNNYDDTQWLPVLLSPQTVSIRQYYTILIENPRYLKLFVNSVKYTAAILLGQALVVPMMAYALSRFTFKGRDAIFFSILLLMVLPFQVTMVPSVITLRFLGILETPWAVILPMWFSPFYVFLLRQFMIGLPNELLEAGMMDGAGAFRCYLHVVLPVCRPVLGAAAALSFADCWNLVEQPLVYLANRTADQPLSVMFNQIGTDSSGVAFAGAALYILPALLVYFFFQEDILLGVTPAS
jgi:multiple sugar transport system permease protein